MREYKIIQENRPSEIFTRWTPMMTDRITKAGVMVDDPMLFNWESLPFGYLLNGKSYCETLSEAQSLIDRYDFFLREQGGEFVVNEIKYKPKQR